MKKVWIVLSLLPLLACHRKEADTTHFEIFYERFHRDSAFQMQHILFPLEGLPDNAYSAGKNLDAFRWEQKDWVIHQPIDFKTSGFKRELQAFNKDLIVERIVHESGDYAMLRRFARINGQWTLIYYAGLNPIQQ
ncbi:MAG: hypothetical protein ACKOAY_04610 [Haliscomenobacter sp.]